MEQKVQQKLLLWLLKQEPVPGPEYRQVLPDSPGAGIQPLSSDGECRENLRLRQAFSDVPARICAYQQLRPQE